MGSTPRYSLAESPTGSSSEDSQLFANLRNPIQRIAEKYPRRVLFGDVCPVCNRSFPNYVTQKFHLRKRHLLDIKKMEVGYEVQYISFWKRREARRFQGRENLFRKVKRLQQKVLELSVELEVVREHRDQLLDQIDQQGQSVVVVKEDSASLA